MTKINRIVMHGFKSFGRRTELFFGGDFNCVLGPNGSGKSNVLDALCFVLGKSSSKSLRADKSANLIYNGGKTKNPSKFGEVSIFFDNSKKLFPLNDNEIKVSRIVKQNGQSKYRMNDKTVTRQQIVDLLSVAKIDPDGYNIIMQGDIARFADMPTKERRQLIEEIAGISVYEEKKQKAINELGKVEKGLGDAEIILTERSAYLKELKKDRDQALKYKTMSDKIRENEASYLKLQINRHEKDKKENDDKTAKEISELDKINSKIDELRNINEEKRKQIYEIQKEIDEKGDITNVKQNKEIENLRVAIEKNKARIETCKAEIEKISKRRTDLKKNIEEINGKIKELEAQKAEFAKKISSSEKEKEAIDARLKKFREKHNIEDAAGIEKEVHDIDKKADELQQKINTLREKQHGLVREKDRAEFEINSVDEKLKKVLEIEKEYKQQIDELKKKRDEFKAITIELNKKLNEDSSLAVQLGAARKKIDNSNEELSKLKARNIGILESMHGDIAVKRINEQKEKIKGIYGTVSELGDVSSKYALALEIAAGPRIKSIVVENDKVASDCIKFLKQNKSGTATFLPLNKIKTPEQKKEVEELAKSKGSHGLAINLIDFEPKFKKVFSYIFANTIVVDDIDVARRLGIGNAKMVSLDGDMAEFSGAMHGGYRERKKEAYGFKEKELNKDIIEYEEVIRSLEKSEGSLEKKRQENEKSIVEMRQRKAELEGEIIKTEKSLHLESGDTDINKKLKEDLLKSRKKIEESISECSMEIAEHTKELTGIKIKKQGLREQINTLRNPALIAELKTFEEKKMQLLQDIISFNGEIKNIELQTNSMHAPETERIKNILKQIDKEEERFGNEAKEISSKTKNMCEELAVKEEKAKEFYQRFKELFGKKEKLIEDIRDNDDKVLSKKESSTQVEIRLNTSSLKNAEITAKLAGLNMEFEKYAGVPLSLNKIEEELKKEIGKFERMKEDIGSVNMKALEIYDEVEKQYKELLEKKDKLIEEKDDVVKLMKEIDGKKKELFMRTFDVVNENFKRMFNTLSSKGDAYLEIENKEDPFEAGVDINVRITGNKFLDIRSLSGGEKTLTALSFIFAIQEHEPASFYVLDEVDAALDKHNSEKFAKLIRRYADKSQYLIVSHNDHVISEASSLYGVSMDEHGNSNVVSLKL